MRYLALLLCLITVSANAQQTKVVKVDSGWANNSVNVTVFRKNAIVSFKDTQFVAYYNQQGYVVLAKRKLHTDNWIIQQTNYKGNVEDAHNSISIMADGDGYLHVAWDHHNNPLNYCKSVAPCSLILTDKIAMTGKQEARITYPEFYKLPDGNLLFLYRNGESGKGNLIIDRYDIATKKWIQLQNNLIDGEGQRNAYWQCCTDNEGVIHLSWVWRESADVASNHDMCYAKSPDGGLTWYSSEGKQFSLPITAASAEYISNIPQNSELINQTSMSVSNGKVFIATYYREKNDSIPQYHIISNSEGKWKAYNTGFRKTAFSLSGVGTKRIPISRPQVITWHKNDGNIVALVYRDIERENKVSMAFCNDLSTNMWQLKDLNDYPLGSWEPTYDSELWKQQQQLHLFVQYAEQKDGEGKASIEPKMVEVLECSFF